MFDNDCCWLCRRHSITCQNVYSGQGSEMRDNFTKADIQELARQSGFKCSCPTCRRITVGPDGSGGSASIGVAAHICAAAAGGPRFSKDMAPEERSSIENGIWLCQTCSRLIDSDVSSHSVALLREWRKLSEIEAYLSLRGLTVKPSRSYYVLEEKMPKLISEMREDLTDYPFTREFITISNKVIYNGSGKMIFSYFFEDHEHLQGKISMCENYGAIVNISFNDVDRYEFTEDFVEYLESSNPKII
jgi:hypothetical protein